ncbi:MAG: patatin-like phospholipase family protein [Prolixibacteraceae bacterium]
MKNTKSALLLSGSGGNISQEVAIIDQLIKTERIQLNQKDTILVASGTSATTAVAINACFRKEHPCSWDNYYKSIFLETLENDEVFMKVHPVQWSTHAMRNKLTMLLRTAGFSQISDLPFHTSLLISSTQRNKTTWIKSKSKKHENGDLIDILMASAALPVLFPPQVINSVYDLPLQIKEGTYAEGAHNGLFFNFRKQLKKIIAENYSIDELFVLSPQRAIDPATNIPDKLSAMTFDEKTTLDNFMEQISLHEFLVFLNDLKQANHKHKFARKISVTLPETGKIYPITDFANQNSKYKMITKWLDENPDKLCVELNEFCENITLIPSTIPVYLSLLSQTN